MDSHFPLLQGQPVSISAGAWGDGRTLSFFPFSLTLLPIGPGGQHLQPEEVEVLSGADARPLRTCG